MTTNLPMHVQALMQTEHYPDGVASVTMLQTHISWVLLAGDYAYKIKKPVDFGFLNFSTLEARKYYCEQELKLNRRLAPTLYLGVLPICQKDHSYALSGDGEVIDYCLKMRRFKQSELFDKRLLADQFDLCWMDSLAQDIAAFHQAQVAVYAGRIDHLSLLREHIHTNLSVAADHMPVVLDQDKWQQMDVFANTALHALSPLLEKRQQQGFVRACHGDLHLRNLAIIDGHPTAFDCIEFNESFSTIDCMNEVAFLVMDCEARKRPDLGMRFLSRYLEQTNDYAGLQCLNLYLFYRAGVRGKVACLLADEMDADDNASELGKTLDEAHHYFELTAHYTRPSQPSLFAVSGLSGSGKSHLSLIGCGIEHAVIIRTDATRKRMAADYPELALYSMAMNQHTYSAVMEAAEQTLKAGFSVILDAAFLRRDERTRVRELAGHLSLPLHFYWLDIETDLLRQRITNRQQAGSDISDADVSVLEMQLSIYQQPDETWIEHLSNSDQWPRPGTSIKAEHIST